MTEIVSQPAHEPAPAASAERAEITPVGEVLRTGALPIAGLALPPGDTSVARSGQAVSPPRPGASISALRRQSARVDPQASGATIRRTDTATAAPRTYDVAITQTRGLQVNLKAASRDDAMAALRRYARWLSGQIEASKYGHQELAKLRDDQAVVAFFSSVFGGAKFPPDSIWEAPTAAVTKAGVALDGDDVIGAAHELQDAVDEWRTADQQLDAYRDGSIKGADRSVTGLHVVEAAGAIAATAATGGLATGALASAGVAAGTAGVYGMAQAGAGQAGEIGADLRHEFDMSAILKRGASDAASAFVGAAVGGAVTKRLLRSLGAALSDASPAVLAQVGEAAGLGGPVPRTFFATTGRKLLAEVLGGAAATPFTAAVTTVIDRLAEPGKPPPTMDALITEVAQEMVQGAALQVLLGAVHAHGELRATKTGPKVSGKALPEPILEGTAEPAAAAVSEPEKPVTSLSEPDPAPATVLEPGPSPAAVSEPTSSTVPTSAPESAPAPEPGSGASPAESAGAPPDAFDQSIDEAFAEWDETQPGPATKPKQGKAGSAPSKASAKGVADYKKARRDFNALQSGYAAKLKVPKWGQVHHAIELIVLKRYPGAYKITELNDLSNMRGINRELTEGAAETRYPAAPEFTKEVPDKPERYQEQAPALDSGATGKRGRRQLHNSKIREVWDRKYAELDAVLDNQKLSPGDPKYASTVRTFLQDARAEIDAMYGQFFTEQRTHTATGKHIDWTEQVDHSKDWTPSN